MYHDFLILVVTSEMIHHHGVGLSKQQTAGFVTVYRLSQT